MNSSDLSTLEGFNALAEKAWWILANVSSEVATKQAEPDRAYFQTIMRLDLQNYIWNWSSVFELMTKQRGVWEVYMNEKKIETWSNYISAKGEKDPPELSHLDRQFITRLELRHLKLQFDQPTERIFIT